MRNSLLHLVPLFFLAAILAVLFFAYWQSTSLEQLYIDQVKSDTRSKLEMIVPEMEKLISKNRILQAHEYCKLLESRFDMRLTLIDPEGNIRGDSSDKYEYMGNHLSRPEVDMVHRGGRFGSAMRYSSTTNERMLYIAVPMEVEEKRYILRGAISIAKIDTFMVQVYNHIIIIGLLGIILVSLLAIYIIFRISNPLNQLKVNAVKIAGGNLDIKLPIPQHGAVHDLALSLSYMAEQLKKQLRQVTIEKNERDAFFAAMTEGVLVIEADSGKIIELNDSAQRILDIDENKLNLSFDQIIANEEVKRFINIIESNKASSESELIIPKPPHNIVIRIRGTIIPLADESRLAVLIVLTDFTKIRQLEEFRKDFIANVSHEIKTPLTVIQGAVETLNDGALADPQAARKFLDIMLLHCKRLNFLVKDILDMANLEQKTLNKAYELSDAKISDVLHTTIESCRVNLEKNNISLQLDIQNDFIVKIDKQLMDQALFNLIDNAIKYSFPNTKITIHTQTTSQYGIIKITDEGIGIAPEHMEHIFERFFRVDKARSRKIGGTGLGLAIVKHIIELHKGKINLESQLGHGSTFIVSLPLTQSGINHTLTTI